MSGLASLQQHEASNHLTKLALVVDDEPTNRLILEILLKKNGFEVIQAENGIEAVDCFVNKTPDIIFMDVMMPVMDGYEAATKIKQLSGEKFIPIIFLTAITDEDSLNRCVEAGGDDFLTKPFNDTILMSKIRAMGRIQELLKQTAVLKEQMQREEEVAEQIFRGAVTAPNDLPSNLHMILQPAGLFSGDMILTSYTPAHDLDILVGDFTGHGLTAAVGALPASEIFHAMSKKGFSGQQILESINKKLKKILPTGMFMAAQFVRVSHEMDHIEVCNSGMPDILILDANSRRVKQRVSSKTLPLGITDQLKLQSAFQYVQIQQGDRVVLFSDGVIETRNADGIEFGQAQLENALENSADQPFAIKQALNSLFEHYQDSKQDDDISIVEVLCNSDLLPGWISAQENRKAAISETDSDYEQTPLEEIGMLLTYHGERLRTADPVPAIVNFIKNSPGLENYGQELFTIFTELYLNALDHGVLGLNSKLKESPEGFVKYFAEREDRLAGLEEGFVQISMKTLPHQRGGNIIIRIEDSGPGFDYQGAQEKLNDPNTPSGRGIKLVKDLCESLQYKKPGNIVEAVYAWKN